MIAARMSVMHHTLATRCHCQYVRAFFITAVMMQYGHYRIMTAASDFVNNSSHSFNFVE
jgi:hypothetical protein